MPVALSASVKKQMMTRHPQKTKKANQSLTKTEFYATFITDFGTAAIFWRENNIVALLLPEKSPAALQKKIDQNFAEYSQANAAPLINRAIKKIQSYFAGKPVKLSDIGIDLSGSSPFCNDVYQQLRLIEAGSTISYKELASAVGNPEAARAVGMAVGKNPLPLLIPCHRVVNANGRLGGFSAGGGLPLKAEMLRLEGHEIDEKPGWHIKPPLLLKDCPLEDALSHLSRADADFRQLIKNTPRCNLAANPDCSIFQSLLEAIVYQQLTGKAAATIYRRVLGLFSGKNEVSALDILRADEDELRSAGLSGNKILAIKDLAEFAISGRLPDSRQIHLLSNLEIINRLTHIRGIGRWTVEMLLIFKLGRADVMAADDYGLRKGLAAIRKHKELPTPTELLKESEAWKPYRSIASWYLWRAAENYRRP